jgi:hypothetical protein
MGGRILELERSKSSVELWDVSGDQVCVLRVGVNRTSSPLTLIMFGSMASRYEACWPAIIKDANGVILVFNPESHVHESEAMLW